MDKTSLLKKLDSVAKLLDEMRLEVTGNVVQDQLIARPKEQIADCIAKELCLNCGKSLVGKKRSRGVHESCYQKLRRDGALDRAELNGRILPAGKPGPKSSDPIAPLIQNTIANKRIAHKKTSARNSD